ncbi:MAG: DNA-directed RNA polymerase subunit D [Nanoarchaeota archaeon]|nr:DNA-directed RNA polymerase subunit D [Nanoarchaeota archaeon]|tara:strand:+ start:805 stop:1569 length:765 start_codon:yes stop_codon:yes gene_type:complete
MQLKLLKKEENKITFLVKETEPYIINALRRMIVEEVPTMAIEDVTFVKNNSALYDEIIAHRLGLLPLTTDLKGYDFVDKCKCKGKGCARCQLKLILEAKGPCTVLSENLKSKDTKIKPAYPDMPITKLLKGQVLQLEAVASLGQGKNHIKFSPGLPYYRSVPILTVSGNANLNSLKEKCKNINIKGKSVEVKDLTSWTEADEQICEDNGIEVTYSDTDFVFTLESWGQLDTSKIMTAAIEMFNSKLKEFDKLVK